MAGVIYLISRLRYRYLRPINLKEDGNLNTRKYAEALSFRSATTQ